MMGNLRSGKGTRKKLIFFTVGTGPYQFNRLLMAADRIFSEGDVNGRFEGLAQIGSSDYVPKNIRHVKFLDKERYESLLGSACIVVHPGGAGTTITCLTMKVRSIIFPREVRYGEIRNDSSTLLAKTLDSKGYATYARDYEGLLTAIRSFMKPGNQRHMKPYRSTRDALCRKLKEYMGRYR
jgi:UDP-N-acetylglucosamine transferase subunit ALG13